MEKGNALNNLFNLEHITPESKIATMEALFSYGANVNSKDGNGDTSLTLAVKEGNLKMVNFLLEKNANPTLQNNNLETPSTLASKIENKELKEKITNKLLEFTKQYETAVSVYEACKNDNPELLLSLLKIDINKSIYYLNHTNEDGETSLHLACKKGNLEMVKCLLNQMDAEEKKKYVERKTKNGITSFYNACQDDHPKVVEYLLNQMDAEEKEKCLNQTITNTSPTLFYSACQKGNLEMVKCLLNHVKEKQKYINKAIKDDKMTPLLIACQNGHPKVVELLLKNDADVNAKNKNGDTPLMFAIAKGYREIAEMLIEKGAKVNEKNNKGTTALMYAVESKDYEIADWLIKQGAKVNEKNNEGRTAFMFAIARGYDEIAELLIKEEDKAENYKIITADKVLNTNNNNKKIVTSKKSDKKELTQKENLSKYLKEIEIKLNFYEVGESKDKSVFEVTSSNKDLKKALEESIDRINKNKKDATQEWVKNLNPTSVNKIYLTYLLKEFNKQSTNPQLLGSDDNKKKIEELCDDKNKGNRPLDVTDDELKKRIQEFFNSEINELAPPTKKNPIGNENKSTVEPKNLKQIPIKELTVLEPKADPIDENRAFSYWYDEEDINDFAKQCFQDKSSISQGGKTFVWLSCFSEDDFKIKKTLWESTIKKNHSNLDEKITFLTAQRINGNHWVNLQIEFNRADKKLIFKLYDPKEQVGEISEELFGKLKSFFKEVLDLDDNFNYEKLITISNCAVQPEGDGSSCGKIVADRISLIIQGKKPEEQEPYSEDQILKIVKGHAEEFSGLKDKINNQNNVEIKLLPPGHFSEGQNEVINKVVNSLLSLPGSKLENNVIGSVINQLKDFKKIENPSNQKNQLIQFLSDSKYTSLKAEFFNDKEEFKNELSLEMIENVLNKLLIENIVSDFKERYLKMGAKEQNDIEEDFVRSPVPGSFIAYLQSTNPGINGNFEEAEEKIKEIISKIHKDKDDEMTNSKTGLGLRINYLQAIALSGENFEPKDLAQGLKELLEIAANIDKSLSFESAKSGKFLDNTLEVVSKKKGNLGKVAETVTEYISSNLKVIAQKILKEYLGKKFEELTLDEQSKIKKEEYIAKKYEELTLDEKSKFDEEVNKNASFQNWSNQITDNIIYYVPQYLAQITDFGGVVSPKEAGIIQKFGLEEFKGHSNNFMLLIEYIMALNTNNNLAAINTLSYFDENKELQKLIKTKAKEIKDSKIDLSNVVNYYFTEIEKKPNVEIIEAGLFYKDGKKEETIPSENIIAFKSKHNGVEYKVAFSNDVRKSIGDNFEKWKNIAQNGFVADQGQQGIKRITKDLYELKPKGDLGNERCYAILEGNILIVVGHETNKNKQDKNIENYINKYCNKKEGLLVKPSVPNETVKNPASTPLYPNSQSLIKNQENNGHQK